MPRDPHLTILIELKESMARIEQKVESSARDISLGVSAHERVGKVETKLSTIWAAIVAIPIISMAVTFFVPDAPPVRELPHR
jgi:hypothetical protein